MRARKENIVNFLLAKICKSVAQRIWIGSTGILKERLLLNHIIVLNNVFGPDACATLLLYKIQPEFWSALKTFLLFLNILKDNELNHIDIDENVENVLKEL